MLSIDQLLTPLTAAQFKTKLYDLAAALGLPTTSWFAGAPTRTLIAITAEIYGAFVAPLIVTITKSGFLDDAEGGWLTLLASTVYGVTRRDATFAAGEVTLDNAGGGVYSFEIGECVFKNSTTDATYVNTEAFTLGALEVGKVVAIRAQDIGSAGNAAATEIDTLVTALDSVTVSNANDLAGVDEESDPDLRQRCRDKLGALSPDGPAAAYRYVALTPELNGGASVTRAKVLPATGDYTVTVVVADATGAPTAPDVALVQAGIDEWATPDNTVATVAACTETPFTADTTIYVNAAAGLTDAEWQALVKEQVVAWVRALPIGGIELTPGTGIIPWRSLVGIIERTRQSTSEPYWVLHATLTSEADFPLADDAVATIDLADVTVTVNQVTQQ